MVILTSSLPKTHFGLLPLMFTNTSLKTIFPTSSGLANVYKADLSQFLYDSDSNSFNHADRVIKLLLLDYKRFLHQNNQGQSFAYYFWVHHLLAELNAFDSRSDLQCNSNMQIIGRHINSLLPINNASERAFINLIDTTAGSELIKLLATFIKFNPNYYLEIDQELLTRLGISSPFDAQWDQCANHIIAKINDKGNFAQTSRLKQFSYIKHYLNEDSLKAIYQAAQQQNNIEMMIEVLKVLPNDSFSQTIRDLIISISQNSESFGREKGFKIINAVFSLFNEDTLIAAYDFFINNFMFGYSCEKIKIPLLIKFQQALPDPIHQYLLSAENRNNVVASARRYCEEYDDINEALSLVNTLTGLIDDFYFLLFADFIKYPSANDKRINFIARQVAFIPDEFKLKLLCFIANGKFSNAAFEEVSEYVRLIYLSLNNEVRKEFEKYFLEIIKKNEFQEHPDDLYILFGKFITFDNLPREAIELFKGYSTSLGYNTKLLMKLLEGFAHNGCDFMSETELTNFAEFLLPYLACKATTFDVAKRLNKIYLKILPQHQLSIQQKLTSYVQAAFEIVDDKEFIFNFVDLSFLLKCCDNPEIIDVDLVNIVEKSIERTLRVIPVLQAQLLADDAQKNELGEQKNIALHLMYASLTLRKLTYFVNPDQKNLHLEMLYQFILNKNYKSESCSFVYLKENFHECDTSLQERFFFAFTKSVLNLKASDADDIEHCFTNYDGDNFDFLTSTYTDLFSFSVNKDKTVNHARAKFIIDNFLDLRYPSTLLFYLGSFDTENKRQFMYYTLVKLSEVETTQVNADTLSYLKNTLAADLYSASYADVVRDALLPHLSAKDICTEVLKCL
jgi:hypothetical protein